MIKTKKSIVLSNRLSSSSLSALTSRWPPFRLIRGICLVKPAGSYPWEGPHKYPGGTRNVNCLHHHCHHQCTVTMIRIMSWFSLQLSFGGTLMVRTPIKVFICIDNSYAWCLRIYTRVPFLTIFDTPYLVFLKTIKRMSNIQPGNSFPLIWFPPWLCFSDYAI